MTYSEQKCYYYGILNSTGRHGFSENASDFNGSYKTLSESEMVDLIRQEPQKHIEWDDNGNPIAVPYNAQYWGEYDTGGTLLCFAGYRFSEKCVRIPEKPNWDE